jgi:hypothetical protein
MPENPIVTDLASLSEVLGGVHWTKATSLRNVASDMEGYANAPS